MDELISIESLIAKARARGVDFGKGDPYNRLRYYTKIGWLPHMVRKKDTQGNTRGHYPIWAVDRLIEVETLKDQGVSNDEIAKKLKIKTRLQSIIEILKTKETRNQAVIYFSFIILVLILGNELGVINLGQSKAALTTKTQRGAISDGPKQLIENGTAFVPKNQHKLFVQTNQIKTGYKVYVTFTQNYLPATRFWVSEIQDYKGFLVELDAPVFDNTEFTWWVTN